MLVERSRAENVDVVDKIGCDVGLVLEDKCYIVMEDVDGSSPTLWESAEAHGAKMGVDSGRISRNIGEAMLIISVCIITSQRQG